MKDAQGHGSNPRGGAIAHQEGVERAGQFKVGDRVKYTGYPIVTHGTVAKADYDEGTYAVKWDDAKPGELASFRFGKDQFPGRVVPA